MAPWQKYFTACHSEEVTTMWRRGQSIREWAVHRKWLPEEIEGEKQPAEVSFGDIAEGCILAEENEEEESLS